MVNFNPGCVWKPGTREKYHRGFSHTLLCSSFLPLICLCIAELKKETRGQIFQQVCITVPVLDCLFHGLGGMRCLEKNSEELCKAALEIEANLGR